MWELYDGRLSWGLFCCAQKEIWERKRNCVFLYFSWGALLCKILREEENSWEIGKETNRVSHLRSAHTRPGWLGVNVAQHNIVNLLTTLWDSLWLRVAMYLVCGPRQLFFFQCGPETPKVWTPLSGFNYFKIAPF